ncbi:MAG: hypothetical protein ACRDWS_06410 [Acidimicrobiia bacterium]
MGRSPGGFGVLGVASADPVLSLLSALGLAQVAGSALVIDLCRDLTLHSGRTLSDLGIEGPTLTELSPGRAGVALLSSGPMPVDETRPAIEALAANWPAIVVRCHPGQWAGPTVPVRPLLPGLLRPVEQGPAVWQPMAAGVRPTGPGPVLPRLRGTVVRRMLSGRSAGRARWVRAWAAVWGMPWA